MIGIPLGHIEVNERLREELHKPAELLNQVYPLKFEQIPRFSFVAGEFEIRDILQQGVGDRTDLALMPDQVEDFALFWGIVAYDKRCRKLTGVAEEAARNSRLVTRDLSLEAQNG